MKCFKNNKSKLEIHVNWGMQFILPSFRNKATYNISEEKYFVLEIQAIYCLKKRIRHLTFILMSNAQFSMQQKKIA